MNETNSDKKIISQHIFMFPFRLKTDITLEEFENKLIEEDWKRTPFTFTYGEKDANLKYNEWVYFHEYARSTLFDDNTVQSVVRHFEREIPKDAYMVYHLKSEIKVSDDKYECKKNWKVFNLKIKNVSLFLFETNVGVLSIELTNETPKDNWKEEIDDILLINDFGRRIYPQFIGETVKNMDDSDCGKGTGATKNSFLADEIEFYFDKAEPVIEEFKTEDYLNLKKDLKIAKYIKYLFGSLKDKIVPLIDDRMFTVCWYGSDVLSRFLQEPKSDGTYTYETSDEWYKFVYIDGKNIGVANKKTEERLIKSATYDRWAEYGTLFGISRYSLVVITDRFYFGYDIIREHMRGVYYKMAILLLAQRASIARFFSEVKIISQSLKEEIRLDEKMLRKVRSLYSLLILFENRLHFAEVTPQEQAIARNPKERTILK